MSDYLKNAEITSIKSDLMKFCQDLENRLLKLELNREHSFHDRKEIREILRNIQTRFLEIEQWMGTIKENLILPMVFEENINNLHKRIDEVELLANAIKNSYNNLCAPSLRKEPYKCPVCCSDGSIPHKVPDEMTADHKGFFVKIVCHSCEGKGVIWG